MKRQAGDAQQNRVNFENARKILFGEEKLDRVDRERWTTAGKLIIYPKESFFTLGEFEFKISDYAKICLKKTDGSFLDIGYVTATKFMMLLPEKRFEIRSDPNSRGYSDIASQVGNTIRCRNTFILGAQTGYDIRWRTSKTDILPNDKQLLEQYYRDNYESKNITFSFNHKKMFTLENYTSGVYQFENASCVINEYGTHTHFFVTISAPWDYFSLFPNKTSDSRVCEYKYTGDRRTWLQSDLEYIATAIDWLMHVLTGPDPRNYGAPTAAPALRAGARTKEESEPTKHYFEFRDGKMINTQQRGGSRFDELYFFAQETSDPVAEAYVIRDGILSELGVGTRDFPNNLNSFYGGYKVLESGKTLADFNAAVSRIERYEQYEYLGSNLVK